MLLRDRLLARLAGMGASPDYVVLASEVLGLRNVPPALAKRLVDQALVVEDRRDAWLRTGERICADAPDAPGVYVLRDAEGRALYVGKANRIRRRLRTHFADRRWRHLKPAFARVQQGEWQVVGSEIEALLREAQLIRDLSPQANVQTGSPSFETRAVPPSLLRDTLVVLPSSEPNAAELLGARVTGDVCLLRTGRDARGLAARVAALRRFFGATPSRDDGDGVTAFTRLAPLVFSWLAGRGHAATRLDPHDVPTARELQRRLKMLLAEDQLFTERIVVIRSVVPVTRP
jgi:predicted GIY-YIG superfamily endonuclease